MREVVVPPQELADEHTLLAQKYAGFFLGHPFRAAQQKSGPGSISVDYTKRWQEPAVIGDDCEFCRRLTDEEAVRRIAGYQHAIDIEVIRPYSSRYSEWLLNNGLEHEELALGDSVVHRGVINSAANRRAYLEQEQESFQHRAISMVALPLRLKRKLCIEWNHLYLKWMREQDASYDHDAREFYRMTGSRDAQRLNVTDAFEEWWRAGRERAG